MSKETCGVIRDLLPLYIDDCCSRESRNLVEKHLAACPDCKREWEEAVKGGPLFLDGAADDLLKKLSEEKPAETLKKGLKKVRKKWIVSIVAMAVTVAILIPLCLLGVNQHRSYGICFTSLDDVVIVNAFLNDLKKNDPDAAFEHIDLDFWRWKFGGYQFNDEIMANFEQDLKAMFLQQAAPLMDAGGITEFKYLSTEMGIRHDGTTWKEETTWWHELRYSVTVDGKTCEMTFSTTENGIAEMRETNYGALPGVLNSLDQYSSILLKQYMAS